MKEKKRETQGYRTISTQDISYPIHFRTRLFSSQFITSPVSMHNTHSSDRITLQYSQRLSRKENTLSSELFTVCLKIIFLNPNQENKKK